MLKYALMTLSIKNGRSAFLRRLDSIFSISFWKEFGLLQNLNDLSVKYLIKLIFFGNAVNFFKI